jgi:hypothetical protein
LGEKTQPPADKLPLAQVMNGTELELKCPVSNPKKVGHSDTTEFVENAESFQPPGSWSGGSQPHNFLLLSISSCFVLIIIAQ